MPLQPDVVSPLAEPYRPASQGPLQAAVDSPVVLPYNPALQLVQLDAPTVLYCPALHAPLQLDAVSPLNDPYRPASQGPLQAAVDNLVVLPYNPALQLMQLEAPPVLY